MNTIRPGSYNVYEDGSFSPRNKPDVRPATSTARGGERTPPSPQKSKPFLSTRSRSIDDLFYGIVRKGIVVTPSRSNKVEERKWRGPGSHSPSPDSLNTMWQKKSFNKKFLEINKVPLDEQRVPPPTPVSIKKFATNSGAKSSATLKWYEHSTTDEKKEAA